MEGQTEHVEPVLSTHWNRDNPWDLETEYWQEGLGLIYLTST
jgi:hypothetical protein